MRNVGKIVCLVGPSGVGKTSYAKRLMNKYNFVLATIVTTRRPRSDDGKNYQYVTETVFTEMIHSGVFLEWDKYSDYYYGTLAQNVEDAVCSGDCFGVVLDLTPNGCRKVVSAIPSAILVAVLPDNPSWLFERLRSRNSQPLEEIRERTKLLQHYLREIDLLACKKAYASFSPDSWDKTFEAIEQIIFSSEGLCG